MSIKSHAFGRVTLTDEDAKKFKNQVVYGKPKAAAVESVRRGVILAREFEKGGKIRISVKRKKVKVA